MSALTLAELERGLYKAPNRAIGRAARLEAVLRDIPVLPFDLDAARAYGQIIAHCGWAKGRDYDRMIAAQAITLRACLVTDNVADFRDIAGLTLENWNA